ncbi:MAG: peptide chain release factor N(5)-glutamine methyltransferase [Spirochaetaceae bacterium]|jgi:release factor glutamine methyltransferase|nr:peptide chain release factor N(5)-glutamine methyltransferase [Spirochaetaceae bacterium]
MIVRDILKEGSDILKTGEIDTAYLDSSILLAKCLGISKEKLYASFPDDATQGQYEEFQQLISKRLDGFPVAYLTGQKEFFGLPFLVDEGVLCPRPDTELLVEKVLSLTENDSNIKNILDLCTGTGCIAISVKVNNRNLNITASDISPDSERIFSLNNYSLAENSITFTKSSLFENIKGTFDIIVSNPPYLTTVETDQRMNDGWKEPELALDGGHDGLDLIRRIINNAPAYLNDKGYLLIEAHSSQMENMKNSMVKNGFKNIIILKDLPGLDRVICGNKG